MSDFAGIYCYASDPTTCDGVTDNNTQHPGWHHAGSWGEIEDALAAGTKVADPDGDQVVEVWGITGERGSYYIAGDTSLYQRHYTQILIQGEMPYSLEDEQEALRSIGAAYQNLRSTQDDTH